MKISKRNRNMLVLAVIVVFIIIMGKVCSLSEEFLEKIILGFLGFEIIAQLDVSIFKNGKNKLTIIIKFLTKTN